MNSRTTPIELNFPTVPEGRSAVERLLAAGLRLCDFGDAYAVHVVGEDGVRKDGVVMAVFDEEISHEELRGKIDAALSEA